MAKFEILINEKFSVTSRYRVILYVIKIPATKKFPLGIKARFVLIDVDSLQPRLLVDNHEPFGFHMHMELPENHDVRLDLSVIDHNEALTVFYQEVERILKNDQI